MPATNPLQAIHPRVSKAGVGGGEIVGASVPACGRVGGESEHRVCRQQGNKLSSPETAGRGWDGGYCARVDARFASLRGRPACAYDAPVRPRLADAELDSLMPGWWQGRCTDSPPSKPIRKQASGQVPTLQAGRLLTRPTFLIRGLNLVSDWLLVAVARFTPSAPAFLVRGWIVCLAGWRQAGCSDSPPTRPQAGTLAPTIFPRPPPPC